LDDLDGHCKPVWLAILATAGLFVSGKDLWDN